MMGHVSSYAVGQYVLVLDPAYGKMIGRVSGVYPRCLVIDGPTLDAARIMQISISHDRVDQYVRPHRPYIPRHAAL